jgi:hypothetical protein
MGAVSMVRLGSNEEMPFARVRLFLRAGLRSLFCYAN